MKLNYLVECQAAFECQAMYLNLFNNFTIPYITAEQALFITAHNKVVQNISLTKTDGSIAEITAVTNATHLLMNWFVKNTNRAEKWSLAAFQKLDKLRKSFTNSRYYLMCFAQGRKEDRDAIKEDIPLLVIGAVLLLAYCSLATFNLKWKANRVLLTLAGLFSAILSLAAAFGLLIGSGVPLVTISLIIPFVVIGKFN